MKKSDYQKERKKYIIKKQYPLPILLIICCFILCIGYASINNITFSIDGIATANAQKGVFISDIEIASTKDTYDYSEIENYYGTLFNTNISLKKEQESNITYIITLYNNSDKTYHFNRVTPTEYDEDFFPNKYITYELSSNIKQGTQIEGNQSLEIEITFKYKDTLDFTNLPEDFQTNLNSFINMEFICIETLNLTPSLLSTDNLMADTYINSDGSIIEYSGWSSSDYIDVSNYSTVIIISSNLESNNTWNAIYDENKNFIKQLIIKKTLVKNQKIGDFYTNIFFLNIKDNYHYLRLSNGTNTMKSVKIYGVHNEEFNGSINLNLLEYKMILGNTLYNPDNNSKNTYINSENGALTSYSGWQSSEYMDISNYNKIVIYSQGNLPDSWNAYYDENKNFIKSINISGYTKKYKSSLGTYVIIPIPEDAKYLRVSASNEVMKALNIDEYQEDEISELNNENLQTGENIHNTETDIVNTYLTKDGVLTNYSGWTSSDYMYIGDYDTWFIVGNKSSFLTEWNILYDENKNVLTSINLSVYKLYHKELGNISSTIYVLNRKSNMKYLRISDTKSTVQSIKIYPLINENEYNGTLTVKIPQ